MKLRIMLLSGLLVLSAQCGRKSEDDSSWLLLLFGGGSGSSNSCKNESGLVICIPPGVPAQ